MSQTANSHGFRTLGRRSLGAAAIALGLGTCPVLAERRGEVILGQDGWIFPGWEDLQRYDADKLRSTMRMVNETVAVLGRAKVACVITLAPVKARIYSDKLPADFRPGNGFEARYATALEQLDASGALAPDLATPLGKLRATEKRDLYFRTDSHWTPASTEPLAVMLAEQMQKHFAFPVSRHPGTRLGSAETRNHPGDLLATLPAVDRAKYPSSEPFQIRKVLAVPSGDIRSGLLEEDGADIAIVGNSYMLPYFGLPPMLSNTLNRPLSLLWRTARVGPWKAMLDYLASELFRQQRPRVLVWHLMESSVQYGPDAAGWWGENAMASTTFLAELRKLAVG